MSKLQTASLKERLANRWCREEFPGGTPRFEPKLVAKDIGFFVLLPTIVALAVRAVSSTPMTSKPKRTAPAELSDQKQSVAQVIDFSRSMSVAMRSGVSSAARTAGTLVKVRLLNTVETFAEAPVHARILDAGLGSTFQGGTLIGQAVSDPASGRIKIDFSLAKYPHTDSSAAPMAARALSLDGTLGIEGSKKEGFFARATLRSGSSNKIAVDDTGDFKTLVARAVANGLMQEFTEEMSSKSAKAQVMMLAPGVEFFVELTDSFPSSR
ncbi:MAG: hypothetical protein EOP05_00230 [Proteobacteria bacterium]|nr:MAG: hypothetical protein EOP05_00230 [Pseudomonadota bacterium]